MLTFWSGAVRALVWLVLAVLALLWSFSVWGVNCFVSVTVVLVKVCGGCVVYLVKGGL